MSATAAPARAMVARRRPQAVLPVARIDEPSPWTAVDRRRAAIPAALGLIGIGVCWWMASGESALRDQEIWLVVGIASLAVSGLGPMVWLAAGFRQVRAARAMLLPRVYLAYPVRAVSVEDLGNELLVGSAMTRAHRAGCLLIAGKDVRPVSESALAEAGLRRCGVCRP